MKKTLLTLALIATTVSAFAQGKISIQNDAAHAFVIGVPGPGDPAGPIPSSPLPSGVTLALNLFAGNSLGTMSSQTIIPLSGANWLSPGIMAPRPLTLSGIAGGAPRFFELIIQVQGASTPQESLYFGTSGVFQATPGSSISFPSLLPGGPSASTWAPAQLVINYVPEPSMFALGGLCAAAMLIFRRRR